MKTKGISAWIEHSSPVTTMLWSTAMLTEAWTGVAALTPQTSHSHMTNHRKLRHWFIRADLNLWQEVLSEIKRSSSTCTKVFYTIMTTTNVSDKKLQLKKLRVCGAKSVRAYRFRCLEELAFFISLIAEAVIKSRVIVPVTATWLHLVTHRSVTINRVFTVISYLGTVCQFRN